MQFGATKKHRSIFVFELESQLLPKVKKHLGPPLEREANAKISLPNTPPTHGVISGPFIEDGRWIVEVPRKTTDAACAAYRISLQMEAKTQA